MLFSTSHVWFCLFRQIWTSDPFNVVLFSHFGHPAVYPPLPLSFPNLIRNFLAPLSSTCYQLTHEPSWTAAGRFNYLILQLIPATSPTWVCGTDGPGRTRLPVVGPHKQAYTNKRTHTHTHTRHFRTEHMQCVTESEQAASSHRGAQFCCTACGADRVGCIFWFAVIDVPLCKTCVFSCMISVMYYCVRIMSRRFSCKLTPLRYIRLN